MREIVHLLCPPPLEPESPSWQNREMRFFPQTFTVLSLSPTPVMIYQIITLVTPHCKQKAVNLYNLVGWIKYLRVFSLSRNGLVVNLSHPYLHPYI